MTTLDYQTRVSVAARESKVVAFVLAQIGKPYEWGEEGPDEYDCSGLVLAAEQQRGLVLPRESGDQAQWFAEHNALASVDVGRHYLVPGDVVYWYGSVKYPESISHTGIYVGRNVFGYFMVVAAVDEHYGVRKHRMRWALQESGYGYAHMIGV